VGVVEPLTNVARLAERPISSGGTPMQAWTRWHREFPPLHLQHCPALVLVAAHPDTETMGLGATAALLAEHGVVVQVVAVTDGETSGAQQRDELIAAARRLGLARPIFLGIPAGEVADNEERLEIELEALLAESPPGAWCAANWCADGDADHEATGRAAAKAAKDAPAVYIEYPMWMWHWAIPDDGAVPWHRARRVHLTSTAMMAKATALQSYSNDTLTRDVIQRQMAVGEIVFV
jgi:LmbE family N-acetylglucosaminyl deacetylase